MHVLQNNKLVSLIISASFVVLVFLLPFTHSYHDEPAKLVTSYHLEINEDNVEKLSPQLLFQIRLHGFLLWASLGFLMPVGILIIRMSNGEKCGRRLKIMFYIHVTLQILSVLLATVAAVLSIKNFENTFNNKHRRLGVALYGIIWVQAIIGFRRPGRGIKGRSKWFFVHWVLGTVVAILGIINIYTGLHAYESRISRSLSLWYILFTVEVCAITFLYLFQDKWQYIQKQGVLSRTEPVMPSTDQVNVITMDNEKELIDLVDKL